jgi:hypothetical protein
MQDGSRLHQTQDIRLWTEVLPDSRPWGEAPQAPQAPPVPQEGAEEAAAEALQTLDPTDPLYRQEAEEGAMARQDPLEGAVEAPQGPLEGAEAVHRIHPVVSRGD